MLKDAMFHVPSKSFSCHPSHACENFQLIYVEVLDPIISVIKERFNHDFLHKNYHDDIEVDYLEAKKDVWNAIFRGSKPTCFRETIKALPSSKTWWYQLLQNFVNYLKLRNFCRKIFRESWVQKLRVSRKKFSRVVTERHISRKTFSRIKTIRIFSQKSEHFKNQRTLFYILRTFNFQKWVKNLIRTFQTDNAFSQLCLT